MEPKTKDLINSQIEKSKEKLNAAKTLLKKGFVDDAISRAYYSMFHAASAVLLSEGITVESHGALKNMFGLHFIKTGKIDKKYGRWLNRLKDERENGDYDIFTSFNHEDAQESINDAEEFKEISHSKSRSPVSPSTINPKKTSKTGPSNHYSSLSRYSTF